MTSGEVSSHVHAHEHHDHGADTEHSHGHGGHGHHHDHASSCGVCATADAFTGNHVSSRHLIAGGVAGLTEHFVAFPFDTVKTRMQQQQQQLANQPHSTVARTSSSFTRTVRGMLQTEPWRNFFRGCGPVLACSFPAHAAYFTLYEGAKNAIGASSSAGYAVASLAATIGHDGVSVPFDVVKQHMQTDGHRHHRNSLECLKCIVRNHGAGCLVRSLPTTVLMNVPHTATHWVAYEKLKEWTGIASSSRASALDPRFMGCGLLAGATAACVSTPLDVVKTRVQLMHSPGMVQAVRDVAAAHGVAGFYKGAVPRMCAIAPSAAVVMATYEGMKVLLKVDTTTR